MMKIESLCELFDIDEFNDQTSRVSTDYEIIKLSNCCRQQTKQIKGTKMSKIEKIEEEIKQVTIKLNDPKLCRGTLDTMARVSGYYRSLQNWNQGKKSEFEQRVEYRV